MSQADAWRTRWTLRNRRGPVWPERAPSRVRFDPRWNERGYEAPGRDDWWDSGATRFIKGFGKAFGIAAGADTMRHNWRRWSDELRKSTRPSDVVSSGDAALPSRKRVRKYDALSVPWRPGGSARWDRGPKRWDVPDQPWPTAASGDGTSGGPVSGQSKTHFNSDVYYTRE